MAPTQPIQEAPGFRGEPESDFAFVPGRTHAPDVSGRHEPVDEPDGTVVTDEKLLGELPNGGLESIARPLDRKQGLVLLGSKPVSPGGRLAENQELPDVVPEVSQQLVIFLRQRGLSFPRVPGSPG